MSGECRGGESGRGNEAGRVGVAQKTTGRGACGLLVFMTCGCAVILRPLRTSEGCFAACNVLS